MTTAITPIKHTIVIFWRLGCCIIIVPCGIAWDYFVDGEPMAETVSYNLRMARRRLEQP